jgi:hypothetical protein
MKGVFEDGAVKGKLSDPTSITDRSSDRSSDMDESDFISQSQGKHFIFPP